MSGAGALAGQAGAARTNAQLGLQNLDRAQQQANTQFSQQSQLQDMDMRRQAFSAQQQQQQMDNAFRQQQSDQSKSQFDQQFGLQQQQYADNSLRQLENTMQADQDQQFKQQYQYDQLGLNRQIAEQQSIDRQANQKNQFDIAGVRADTQFDVADLNGRNRLAVSGMNNQSRVDVATLNNQTRSTIAGMTDQTKRAQFTQKQDNLDRTYQLQKDRLQQQAQQFGVTSDMRSQDQQLDAWYKSQTLQNQRDAQVQATQRFNTGQQNDATGQQWNKLASEFVSLRKIDPKTLAPDQMQRYNELDQYFQRNPAPPVNQVPMPSNGSAFQDNSWIEQPVPYDNSTTYNGGGQSEMPYQDWQEQPVPVSEDQLPQGNGPAMRVTGAGGESHDFVQNPDGTYTDMQTGRRYTAVNGVLRAM